MALKNILASYSMRSLIIVTGLIMAMLACRPKLGTVLQSRDMLALETVALKKAHSHNDYTRHRPLQDALDHGFISVEADILLKNGKLFVGHSKMDLLKANISTLEESYLKPLYERFQKNGGTIYPGKNAPFYLWIDIKYAADEVYDILKKQLVIYKEMLHHRKEGKLYPGQVLVILSGDRPFQKVLNDTLRLMTLDGRMGDLEKNYSPSDMPFVSEHYKRIFKLEKGRLTKLEFEKLINFAQRCHQQGKKVRLWATPESEELWAQLLKAKVDLINTDELDRLQRFLMSHKKGDD